MIKNIYSENFMANSVFQGKVKKFSKFLVMENTTRKELHPRAR